LWQTWEHQLMATIVGGLNIALGSKDKKDQKKAMLIDYLIRHLNVSKKNRNILDFLKLCYFYNFYFIIYSNITCMLLATGFVKLSPLLISFSKCLS
jgi:hypothetical protein